MNLAERNFTTLLDEVCCGNPDALRFLMHWNLFCHGVDDLIDMEDRPCPEDVISTFSQANILFTQPFYQANFARLQTTVMLSANAYADSVAWEKSPDKGHRILADVIRSYGNEMFMAVALICGGYQHMRRISQKVRDHSWKAHHDENGEPK
jgi:hypothetical protein